MAAHAPPPAGLDLVARPCPSFRRRDKTRRAHLNGSSRAMVDAASTSRLMRTAHVTSPSRGAGSRLAANPDGGPAGRTRRPYPNRRALAGKLAGATREVSHRPGHAGCHAGDEQALDATRSRARSTGASYWSSGVRIWYRFTILVTRGLALLRPNHRSKTAHVLGCHTKCTCSNN